MSSSYRPLAVAAVLCLGACSGPISQSDLEERVADAVFTGVGAFPAVSCGELVAEVDATTTCSVFFSDSLETMTVDLIVTSVDSDTVRFAIARRT